MKSRITPELLIAITNRLAQRYGPDRAHDVLVKMLESKTPIKHPRAWARKCAVSLATKADVRGKKFVLYADMNKSERKIALNQGFEYGS